jgi:LysR family hydrogen peroxide-inducible transcriptional activator
VEEKTAGLLALLHGGEIDGAVLALEADLGDPSRLVRELLFDDPFVLAAPKGHRLSAGKGPVRLHDLAGEEVLLLDDGHCFGQQALSLCARAKAPVESSAFRATSMTTLVQMAAAGAGVTLLPKLAAEAETRRTGLVLRQFAEPVPHRTLALVHRKGDPGSATASAVAASLRESGRAA